MGEKAFFTVPCEMQARYRVISEEEFQVFKVHGLRPSPGSSIREEVENQVKSLDLDDTGRSLVEKLFKLILNIDQRIERIEESLQKKPSPSGTEAEPYEFYQAELGAEGILLKIDAASGASVDDIVLLDMILPSLPEHRIVAAGTITELEPNQTIRVRFSAIHGDDREFIHRFSMIRQRELLRERAREEESD